MRPACVNHPHLNAHAKGLCMSCYQRERRRAASPASYTGRAPTGSGYADVIARSDEWRPRFLSEIEIVGECHEWRGPKTKGGYGVFYAGGKTLLAHRIAFELAHGPLGTDLACHTCDNPACVNPAHLFRGAYADNVRDMDAKGRRVVGTCDHLRDRENHPRAKRVVTPEGVFPSATMAAEAMGVQVRKVTRLCAAGEGGWAYL